MRDQSTLTNEMRSSRSRIPEMPNAPISSGLRSVDRMLQWLRRHGQTAVKSGSEPVGSNAALERRAGESALLYSGVWIAIRSAKTAFFALLGNSRQSHQFSSGTSDRATNH